MLLAPMAKYKHWQQYHQMKNKWILTYVYDLQKLFEDTTNTKGYFLRKIL